MKHLRAALAGILALVAATAATAQQFPTVPAQTVIGRMGVPGDTGPSQAIPFTTFTSRLLSAGVLSGLALPTVNASSDIAFYDTSPMAAGQGGRISFGGKINNTTGTLFEWAAIGAPKLNSTAGNTVGSLAFYLRSNAGDKWGAPKMTLAESGLLTVATDGIKQLGILDPTKQLIIDGSAANPVTSLGPTVLVSRLENQASFGSQNAAIYGMNVGLATSNGQPVAIQGYTYNLGNSDTNTIFARAEHRGVSGRAAIGGFFNALAYTAGSSAEPLELETTNNTGVSTPYASNLVSTPVMIGIDNNYSSTGVFNGTAAMVVRSVTGQGKWDVGIGFNRFGGASPTITADIQTDSDADSILLANSGAHRKGIDLTGTGSTYSGNAFMSPGFSVGGTGIITSAKNAHFQHVAAAGAGIWVGSLTTGDDRFFIGGDAAAADSFRLYSVLSAANVIQYTANATPSLGALTIQGSVTATKYNGNIISTGTGTLTLGAGKTFTVNNTLGLSGTDGSTLNIGTGGTLGSFAFLSALPTQATNTVLGNATSGTAAPTALAVGSCSTSSSALIWTTNTGFGCNTSINAATLGSATFAAPGAIGGGTPSTGAFTTVSGSTSITSPLHIGGSGTTGTQLTLKTTTGNGTTDAFAFTGGNNGATTFATLQTGSFNIQSGSSYNINGTSVLNATTLGSGVTASSLTSVGTLTGLSVTGAVGITASRGDGGYQYALINTGANAKNYGFAISTADGSWQFNEQSVAVRLSIGSTGGLSVGVPTGGDKGSGTVNAAGAYYANGTKGCSGTLTTLTSITITNGIITAMTGTGGPCA